MHVLSQAFQDKVEQLKSKSLNDVMKEYPFVIGGFFKREGDFKARHNATFADLNFQTMQPPQMVGRNGKKSFWHHNLIEKGYPRDWMVVPVRDLSRTEQFLAVTKSGFKSFLQGAALTALTVGSGVFTYAAITQPSPGIIIAASTSTLATVTMLCNGAFGKLSRHFHDAVANAHSTKLGLAIALAKDKGSDFEQDKRVSSYIDKLQLVKY